MKKLLRLLGIKPQTETDPLDLFDVVGQHCPLCGHGPIIKYEPAQFKYQCWTCKRIADKVEMLWSRQGVLRLPEASWIEARIKAGKRIPPEPDTVRDQKNKEARKELERGIERRIEKVTELPSESKINTVTGSVHLKLAGE